MVKSFFGERSVFAFDEYARLANDAFPSEHWNGGIHYYFWVGALVEWIGNEATGGGGGGALGQLGAYHYEYWQKRLGGVALRGQVQLKQGFQSGAATLRQFIAIIDELEGLDPRFVSR